MSGLILPPQHQDPLPEPEPQGSVESMIDLYDTDILRIERVVETLKERTANSVDMEGFRLEVIDRFAKIGLVVNVKMYDTNEPGVYIPEIEINGRTEAIEFDRDQQTWEVTHDVLGIDQPGIVTEGGGFKEVPLKIGMTPGKSQP